MKKFFLFSMIMLMAVAMQAETSARRVSNKVNEQVTIDDVTYTLITDIEVTIELPKAGDDVATIKSTIKSKASVPADAHYSVNTVSLGAKSGSLSETALSPNTTYKLQIIIAPNVKENYLLAVVENDETYKYKPDSKKINATVNGETITNMSAYSGLSINENLIALTYYFTTGDLEDVIAAPQFSYTLPWITDYTMMALTCGTEGAQIYYTTDGTDPSATNGTLYTKSFIVEGTPEIEDEHIVVKAVAIKGDKSSAVITQEYYFQYSENWKIKYDYQTTQGMVEAYKGETKIEDGESVYYNTTITLKATPKRGYIFEKYKVDGTEQDEPTFKMLAKEEVKVGATFKYFSLPLPGGDWSMYGEQKIENYREFELTCAIEGASIYYAFSLDEALPAEFGPESEEAILYEGPFTYYLTPETKDRKLYLNLFATKDGAVSQRFAPTFTCVLGEYEITAQTVEHGTITVPEKGLYSETIELSATPDDGYKFGEWIVNDEDNNPIAVSDNKFTMPDKKVTVSAIFVEDIDSGIYEPSVSSKAQKVIENGVIYILRDGKRHNLLGAEVK